MSKLMLVSDYDGTLKTDIKNLRLNIDVINKFRECGNIFTISTGRTYQSIKNECIKYNIKYDYLFCNDGIVLFDNNDNILFEKTIDIDEVTKLISIVNNYNDIKDVELYNAYNITHSIDDNIIILFLKLNILHNLTDFYDIIANEFNDIEVTKHCIYLMVKKKFDKSMGLEVLSSMLSSEIPKDNIITVGDNYNDLSMLKNFNGYKVLSSYPNLYFKGIKTTKEVHTLVKKLIK